MMFLWLTLGLVALVLGAELLVRGAARLGAAAGISSLVVGLTVVAFGTSAPEFSVSIASAFSGRADIALGNVVGSNIFNVLFILGLSALVVPLVVDQKLVRFDVPLMVGASFVVLFLGLDGQIGRFDGLLLFAGLLGYTIWCIVAGRNESAEVQHEYDEAFGDTEQPTNVNGPKHHAGLLWQLGLIAVGLVLLVLGSNWLVEGATELARRLGVSELVIGLTIVAGGTSLPELTTSLVAAYRGERDIAVGNVVGSNLFNLLGVLGLTAVIAPNGISVAAQTLQFDIPVMIAVSVACLPIFFTGHRIARWEGALFLGYYIAYTAALVMTVTNNQAMPVYRWLMVGFVLPLTAVTLLLIAIRAYTVSRSKRHATRTGAR